MKHQKPRRAAPRFTGTNAPGHGRSRLPIERTPALKLRIDRRSQNVLVALFLCALTLLAYSNSFGAGIVLDNKAALLQDPRIRSATGDNLTLIFKHTYWWPIGEVGLYRPLTTLSYLFNYSILGNGDHVLGYHCVNLVLHIVNAMLVFAVARKLLGQIAPSALLAALWAAHPASTESVTNIVGRSDLLAAMATLSGFLMYVKSTESPGLGRIGWLAGLGIMTTVGAYSKENAVMIVGVIALYAWAWPKRRRWSDVLFGFLATGIPIAVMLVQRTSVLAGSLPAEFAYTDNPIAEATFWTGHLTALKVLGTYLAQAVWPWRLSIDYSYAQIPLGIKSAEDWISLALSLLAAVAMAGLWNRNRTAFFFVAFALMVFLPTSNLVFPIGTIRADRFLYLPSVGLLGCLVMAVYAFGFRVKLPQVAPAFLLVLTAAFALRTWARNAEWRDELTLARADVQTSPNSFKLHQMIARSMFATESSRPDIGLVVDEIDKSLAVLDPLPEARNNPEAYDIAGFAYLTEGDRLRAAATGDAESAYRRSRELLEKCIRINKAYERQRQAKYGKAVTVGAARTEPAAHLLLSIVDQRLGDLNAATQEANVAQRMAPQDPRMYKRIADLLLTREQGEEAAVALMKGMLITSDPELRSDLVRLYASSTDPANCTLLPGANSPAINLRCPLVLDHICAAAPDVLTTLITMGRREEAELQKQRFTTEYQCNPTPLNAALPSKQR